MAANRRMLVLRAVVEDYIRSQEPVGSGAVARDHKLGVSSATVRNDMAALEDEGYLVQPHTSAGRVPTQKGYRYFVDRLARMVPLSGAQRKAIDTFLSGSVSLDDALQRAARLLAQITGQVAVVASPSLAKSRLRRLELIGISGRALLVVVITDNGRVAQHTLSLHQDQDLGEDLLAKFSESLNKECRGMTLSKASERLETQSEQVHEAGSRRLLEGLAQVLEGMADEEESSGLYMAGRSQLTRRQTLTVAELAPLLDALEEQVVLMRLMSAQSELSRTHGGVSVAIGSETRTPGLLHASIVTSGYGHATGTDQWHEGTNGQGDGPIAFVGSIGPTHMDYTVTMSAVRAVAAYLTSFLTSGEGEDG
ncbi:Heat-inducible transcription repressor hrcA [Bifidobacterium actinocoloniiforme DSM 22766]|uniref:Heat-inducible transcription repressor HrcA n=1 Tax=Bifidobacterium actinocoloniiforme DSM 22766 TaxID=1437605 RepID=A0A086Z0I5_9BIFI|nr:heat-inducible transcriptional repressor HrcA [Bifidobacterium actinocoloniiforme]AKV55261.1 HrcA family transcriptional regulator [Bifidobacterium actinocoloniiforme DSM 22766]KFI40035.1 Heat-inducible transcription repressor hrcA [Bifidobacterium actinocoloniiforme DSM 22766]